MFDLEVNEWEIIPAKDGIRLYKNGILSFVYPPGAGAIVTVVDVFNGKEEVEERYE
jgi:hypothetical protein